MLEVEEPSQTVANDDGDGVGDTGGEVVVVAESPESSHRDGHSVTVVESVSALLIPPEPVHCVSLAVIHLLLRNSPA